MTPRRSSVEKGFLGIFNFVLRRGRGKLVRDEHESRQKEATEKKFFLPKMPKRGMNAENEINAEKVPKRLVLENNTQFLDLMSEKVVHDVDKALIFRIF